jgi:hypothetical protein
MSSFLDKFPRIQYDITRSNVSNYEDITNVLFRVGVVKSVLNNVAAYFEYAVLEGETPEILADRVYGSPEAHWIILYANDIYDPQFDWPLHSRQFSKYVRGKYGSIETAKTTFHHYEKVIERSENDGPIYTTRFIVDYDKKTNNEIDEPYDTYLSLPEEQSVETFNIGNGKTVKQITYRNAVTNYDYELQENEKKRFIKVIKKEYYGVIMEEFRSLTASESSFIRRLS